VPGYFLMDVFFTVVDPLVLIAAIGIAFCRRFPEAAGIALLAAIALGGLQTGLSPGWQYPVVKALGVLFWAGIGWSIGNAVRKARAQRRAVVQSGTASGAASPGVNAAAANPTPVTTPSFAAVSSQIVLVRRALGLGQELKTLAAQSGSPLDAAAIERDLAVLEQARAQLHGTKQPLVGEAAHRVDAIAAQFDALWQRHNGRG